MREGYKPSKKGVMTVKTKKNALATPLKRPQAPAESTQSEAVSTPAPSKLQSSNKPAAASLPEVSP